MMSVTTILDITSYNLFIIWYSTINNIDGDLFEYKTYISNILFKGDNFILKMNQ